MKPKAYLSKPSKNAMQSGLAKTKRWLLEFPHVQRYVEPLMGWVGTQTTHYQKKLWFPTKEDAIAYLQKHSIPYEYIPPDQTAPKAKSYGDRFKAGRLLK